MLGLRCGKVRWATALRWIAAMAYGSRFCDLFGRVELLPRHTQRRKSWLAVQASASMTLANCFLAIVDSFGCWQPCSTVRRKKLSKRRTFEIVLSSRASKISCFRAASTASSKHERVTGRDQRRARASLSRNKNPGRQRLPRHDPLRRARRDVDEGPERDVGGVFSSGMTHERGKHDGGAVEKDSKEIRYFTCPAGAGSFVKPKKVDRGSSFVEALRQKYAGLDAPVEAPLGVDNQ